MSEKAPQEGEGQVDHSRRGFLKGILGAGVVAAVGGTILAKHELASDEHVSLGHPTERPYDVPVEGMTKEEAMREIVHDQGRVVSLRTIGEFGAESIQAVAYENIAYFLESYRASGTTPTKEEIDAEIARLEERIEALRNHRDHH